MNYELAGKKVNKGTAKSAKEYSVKNIETKVLVITLIKRHKFGLSAALNVIFIVYLFLPFLPGEIANLLGL